MRQLLRSLTVVRRSEPHKLPSPSNLPMRSVFSIGAKGEETEILRGSFSFEFLC